MPKPKRIHARFITVCASWASLNNELDLAAGTVLKLIDRLTIAWSFVIFITNIVKFLTFQNKLKQTDSLALSAHETLDSYLHKIRSNPEQVEHYQLKHLLVLDYLPRINDFGKLYYGLVSVSIGAPLAWRIYLNLYRPHARSRASLSSLRALDTKRDLVRFFIRGPHEHQAVGKKHFDWSQSSWFVSSDKADTSRRPFGGPNFKVLSCIDLDSTRRRKEPLSRLHARRTSGQLDGRFMANLSSSSFSSEHLVQTAKTFRIPIRVFDFLQDRSKAHWLFLIKLVYFMCTWVSSVSVPILWLTVGGLATVMKNFSIPISRSGKLGLFMVLYGHLEQFYACTQAALFFIFTNIFITLFHADIVYKLQLLKRDLVDLNRRYLQVESGGASKRTLPTRKQVHTQQLKLWALFDQISQIDDFVSKYSVISMVTFVIGVSFGQSYLKVQDQKLKLATASVLLSNLLSFSYLYLLSWDIEKRVS